MFKEWSKLFRSQTAPATAILAMIGFLLGGGKLFSLYGILMFVFLIFLHWFIFGNNSLMDACIVPGIGDLSYDAQDRWKTHHPLITGKIKFSTAHKVIYPGLVFLSVIAMVFAYYGSGNAFFSLCFFLVFVSTGFAYNCGLSKVTIWKFLPIAACFTSLYGYAYFIFSDTVSILFISILVYIFLAEIFEVGIEGEQKEIDSASEINLLKFLGTKTVGNKIYMSLSSKIVSWFLKILIVAVGGYILYKAPFNYISIVLFVFFSIISVYFTAMINHNKEWGRDIKLRHYGLTEIATIYILPSVLIPVIGLLEAVTLMVFGVVYFMIFNRLNWGTFFAPRV
jgi:hypothetical protein